MPAQQFKMLVVESPQNVLFTIDRQPQMVSIISPLYSIETTMAASDFAIRLFIRRFTPAYNNSLLPAFWTDDKHFSLKIIYAGLIGISSP